MSEHSDMHYVGYGLCSVGCLACGWEVFSTLCFTFRLYSARPAGIGRHDQLRLLPPGRPLCRPHLALQWGVLRDGAPCMHSELGTAAAGHRAGKGGAAAASPRQVRHPSLSLPAPLRTGGLHRPCQALLCFVIGSFALWRLLDHSWLRGRLLGVCW